MREMERKRGKLKEKKRVWGKICGEKEREKLERKWERENIFFQSCHSKWKANKRRDFNGTAEETGPENISYNLTNKSN